MSKFYHVQATLVGQYEQGRQVSELELAKAGYEIPRLVELGHLIPIAEDGAIPADDKLELARFGTDDLKRIAVSLGIEDSAIPSTKTGLVAAIKKAQADLVENQRSAFEEPIKPYSPNPHIAPEDLKAGSFVPSTDAPPSVQAQNATVADLQAKIDSDIEAALKQTEEARAAADAKALAEADAKAKADAQAKDEADAKAQAEADEERAVAAAEAEVQEPPVEANAASSDPATNQ